MIEDFKDFKSFMDSSDAEELIDILHKNDIKHIIDKNIASIDTNFSGQQLTTPEINLRIKADDFDKVYKLYLLHAKEIPIEELPESYYLFDFSDEELVDIIMHPQDWSLIDFKLAYTLLKKNKVDVVPLQEIIVNKAKKTVKKTKPVVQASGTVKKMNYFIAIIDYFYIRLVSSFNKKSSR